ncbi:hypothetical protein [Ammoniphilus sp. YIM 78166]|uniref:hypothetical protein n=1 Tax=Ammoniphilus sp. YIM 78166 TaxID=1644106 RepID=UPI00142FACAB|nr:hypothetical protein [Ammoniphilus sp. YIM 78166]
MARSIKEHMPDAKMILCVVEKKLDPSLWEFSHFDHLVLAKDLGINDFETFIFKYNRFEAANSLKAKLLKYCLKKFRGKPILYLDTDIRLYGPLTEIQGLLKKYDILFTPHIVRPIGKASHIPKFELPILRTGIFNAGFMALKRSKESRRFLDWWDMRLDQYCYKALAEGLFFDQKWLNLALYYFNVGAITHPGYNVAYWNTTNRKVSLKKDSWLVDGEPLKFFHFSGAETGRLKSMVKKYAVDRSSVKCLLNLRDSYISELREMGQKEQKKADWSYDYFSSGELIQDESRIAYRVGYENFNQNFKNPFNQSNATFIEKNA